MGLDRKKKEEMDTESSSSLKEELSDSEGKPISRQPSEASIYTEEDEELGHIQLGPKCTIKEHLEKDKVFFFLIVIIIYFSQ